MTPKLRLNLLGRRNQRWCDVYPIIRLFESNYRIIALQNLLCNLFFAD